MKARYRERTAKYKSLRRKPDALFLSRTFQTFFNKFTKKGKKAIARRHITAAFSQLRFTICHPRRYTLLIHTFTGLQAPLGRVYRRKGKVREVVPVPVRRNKGKTAGLHLLYQARKRRRERDLTERIQQERSSVAQPSQSPTFRRRSDKRAILYAEQINLKRR